MGTRNLKFILVALCAVQYLFSVPYALGAEEEAPKAGASAPTFNTDQLPDGQKPTGNGDNSPGVGTEQPGSAAGTSTQPTGFSERVIQTPLSPEQAFNARKERAQRNLEETIQKVGAKTDRPQDKDADGNLLAPEQMRHRDEAKAEWDSDVSDKVTKAQQQALQTVGGTIEMPAAKKAEADKKAAEAEKKLEKVVKSLEAGELSADDTRRVELLIETYRRNPSETNANQIISQVVNIGEKVAAVSATPGAIERSPEIFRATESQESQYVIEAKTAEGGSLENTWAQDTTRKMKEISSLLKTEKKTITPAALAAKELTETQVSPIVRSKMNPGSFDAGQAKPSPTAFIQSSAKAWVSKLLQALTKKPAEANRDLASVPEVTERQTASTPELKVDSQILSVEGSVGPLTAAIVNPEPSSVPLIPTSLLFGLGLLLTGALLLISKVRR